MDDYRHGYPLRVRKAIRSKSYSSSHPVGDLRISGTVEALPGCESVILELREGIRRYRSTLPGPAAAADARPSVQSRTLSRQA